MAGKGRPKGSPNKTSAAKRVALALAGEAIAAAKKGSAPKVKARKGISPKELMLDSMRQAWEAGHALLEAARAKRIEADKATDPAVKAKLIEECIGLQLLASQQNEMAIETATKVAPYEHPKLANLDGKLSVPVRVIVKTF